MKTLHKPMTNLQKQKLFSYYQSSFFRRGRPTLNRLQNLFLYERKNTHPFFPPRMAKIKSKSFYGIKTEMILQGMRKASQKRIAQANKEFSILLSSQFVRLMLLLPMMYLSYRLGKQFYIEYQSYYYKEYYIHPVAPIKDDFKVYIGSVIRRILTDREVERTGVEFLSKLFLDPNTHEAAVILLKNVLKDPRFVQEGKTFGIDLISNVIRSSQCEEDFKNIVIKSLEDEAIKKQTVEILKYIV